MTVAINYFIELLEIDPVWIKILLFVLVVNCLYPWKLSGKIETEEKDGKKVSKIYHFK